MADIFSKENVRSLLRNRNIFLLGDSNMRATYKDIVWLLQRNTIINALSLRSKLEPSFMNDVLTKGDFLHRGRSYEEERLYVDETLNCSVEFMFLTKCLTDQFRERLLNIRKEDSPDILIINSCLWDICRWGPDGVTNYKKNILELMKLLKERLSPATLVIWTTTPPLAAQIHGGVIIKQIEFMKYSARFEVMEGNMFVRQEVISHGFDILDLHYYLLLQIDKRCPDGIHWQPATVRYVTNLILTHISLALGEPLPGNNKSPVIDRLLLASTEDTKSSIQTKERLQSLMSIACGFNDTNNKNSRNNTYSYRGRFMGVQNNGSKKKGRERLSYQRNVQYRPY